MAGKAAVAKKKAQKKAPPVAQRAPARQRSPVVEAVPPIAAVPAQPAAEATGAPSWATQTVQLRDLLPWSRNPRKINAQQSARLLDSFEEFGQVEVLAIGPNREVYNGHQRLKVLAEKHGLDYAVEARVCSRELSEKEREKLTIYLHKGAAGEFDLEMLLQEFNPAELNDWGMPDLNIPDVAATEWTGMPEFDGSPKSCGQVVVRFDTDEGMAQFAALVQQPVTKETVSIWFPPHERFAESAEQWSEDDDDES